MNSRHTAREILVSAPANHKSCVDNHVSEVFLRGEPLNALYQVLITVAVAGDELSDQRDCAERPFFVEGVEQRDLVGFAEFEAGEDAAGLEHAVGLAQGGGDIGEVADAEGDGVQVDRVGGDGGGRGRAG